MKHALMPIAGFLLVAFGAFVTLLFSVLADGERGMFAGPKVIGGVFAALGIVLIVIACVGWLRRLRESEANPQDG